MKFATVKQIVVVAVISCVGLFALDYFKNPQLWSPQPVAAATAGNGPELTLWMNHLCCDACLDNIRQALNGVPGIDVAKLQTPDKLRTREEADKLTTSLPTYSSRVVIPVTDLAQLDIMAVDRAIRAKGLVPGRIEVSGVEHFRIEAKMGHLCCGTCDRAAQEHITMLKARGLGGQFTWLDSMTVNHENGSVIAYARYLERGKSVDVAELINGLAEAGFVPLQLRVLNTDEAAHSHDTSAPATTGHSDEHSGQHSH